MRWRMWDTHLRLKKLKHRVLKTIGYRVIATLAVQGVTWLAFHRTDVNAMMLCLEPVRMMVYYVWDWFCSRYA